MNPVKLSAFFALAGGLIAAPLHGAQVTVTAAKDNTLFQSATGEFSNGAGPNIFCGQTGSGGGNIIQRGLFEFDLAGRIPAGATITSAEVTLTLIQGGPFSGSPAHTLHRVLAEWGEGTSIAGGGSGAPSTTDDATWIHTFYPHSFWINPGGDFSATVSASQIVGNTPGPFTWASTPQLVADVQAWVDDPSSNHGWMIRGDEATAFSSKKFASHENTPCTADIAGPAGPGFPDGNVDSLDFLTLIAQWGSPGNCDGTCEADITGPAAVPDGNVDSLDYLLLIAQWGSPGNCPSETDAPKLTVTYTLP
jgi:hypothetical protein